MKLFFLFPRGKAKGSVRVCTKSTKTWQGITYPSGSHWGKEESPSSGIFKNRKKLDPRKEGRLPSFFGQTVSNKIGS